MTKSQKHGNREAKKPKAVKVAPELATANSSTKENAGGAGRKRS